jgi:hypothetical protein
MEVEGEGGYNSPNLVTPFMSVPQAKEAFSLSEF